MDDLDQLFAANIAKINYEGKDAEAISCKAKEMLRLMNMKLPHGSLRKVGINACIQHHFTCNM